MKTKMIVKTITLNEHTNPRFNSFGRQTSINN